MIENVKDDGRELELLLNEIPRVTSSSSDDDFVNPYQSLDRYGNHDNDYDHDLVSSFVMKQNQGNYGNGNGVRGYDEEALKSPVTVSGFSMQSENGSSSSFFSDYGTPTPPLMEDPKSTTTAIGTGAAGAGTGTFYNPNNPDFSHGTDRFVDLCSNFSRMYTSNQQDNPSVDYNSHRNGFLDSDSVRFQSHLLNNPIRRRGAEISSALTLDYGVANSFGSSQSCSARRERGTIYSHLNGFGNPVDSALTRDHGVANSYGSSQSCSERPHRDTIYSQLNGFGSSVDSDSVRFQPPFLNNPISHRRAEMNSAFAQDYGVANSFGSSQSYSGRDYGVANSFRSSQSYSGQCERDTMYSQLNDFGASSSTGSSYHRSQHYRGTLGHETAAPYFSRRNSVVHAPLHSQNYGMNYSQEPGTSRLPFHSLGTDFRPSARVVLPSNARRIPQGNIDMNAVRREGSFILQGDEGLSYVGAGSSDRSDRWCQNAAREFGFPKHLYKSEVDIQHPVMGACETPRSSRIGSPFTLPPNYNSLSEAPFTLSPNYNSPSPFTLPPNYNSLSEAPFTLPPDYNSLSEAPFALPPNYNSLLEARGSIYLMTQDQNGCRYLQRMFEEGRIEDVQIIFDEIIGHMVELMTSPFGNYLIQKLLDVCSEEQRMKIIIMVIQEPGQLVEISLNAHGTRVVQKLIETLKTEQQTSLVVSALEPGSLTLIKDLHGNHVVQHCLECLSNEDNKFIYVAAVKYCVDIATHQHGCCVLQKCIRYSSGEHREILAAEIFANALLLAQDKYGNYVVQCTLDLKIASAATTLTLQFEGSYAHMSMQRYSSHVVEKCLEVFNDEQRAEIIHELLSDPHFDQLLQDPQANYVIQKALRCSEGHVYNSLVETIESYKTICRNSPYSKKIFSQKLLKK
ncbi:unnamed protein product [Lathyrus oleraceus]|uniref:PUM-HD domain-containing protein n=1 Tax=Pisum sativum TaxID=3888 RepID=A0A9D5BRG2_PEA|nr:uncharacterized protein LOC127084675 [Pisum sativum]KAI5448434.1 hypothetical protein KIW84_015739 [Pisum sativum]